MIKLDQYSTESQRTNPHRFERASIVETFRPNAKPPLIQAVYSPGWTDDAKVVYLREVGAEQRMAARLYRAAHSIVSVVDVDRDRNGGAPVLRNTRFPVAQIVAQLADGDTVDGLADDFDLDAESIRQFLRCLSDFLARPIANERSAI